MCLSSGMTDLQEREPAPPDPGTVQVSGLPGLHLMGVSLGGGVLVGGCSIRATSPMAHASAEDRRDHLPRLSCVSMAIDSR
jgi:hypothetical protein